MRLTTILLAMASLATISLGQTPTSPTPSPSLSLSLTTAVTTFTTSTRTRNQFTTFPTTITTTFNVTYTISPTTSSTSSNTITPTPTPIALETKVDPAFGVLGAILILTGLPSAFWGHKNRWTSFFLIGFYTLSLVCIVLILKFGVLPAINPPSTTLRGMFVLSCVIAGTAGGAIAIFFWKAARYCIGAWGGFALALWIQCFHDGGLVKPIAFRWIMYIGCAVVGFVLCTIPKIHYHVLLVSTALVGSSAFMLGVDCFTTAGLKEFYIWNLGFKALFPKFTENGIEFPVSQTMQIELGITAAVALMGTAVQLRILTVLERKLKEIAAEQKKRDEEAEVEAADRFASVLRERENWEKDHGGKPIHSRYDSGFSSVPLMKDQDGSSSPVTPGTEYYSPGETRMRRHSNMSDFMAAPTPDEELRRASRSLQAPGALPALDLGLGIQDDVPQSFIAKESARKDNTQLDLEDFKRKEDLVAEIQTIRRSIDALKSETPAPSSSAGSRHPSLTSRRTLSIDASTALLPPPQTHLRPPRERDPRSRVRSMDIGNLAQTLGDSISRPTSVPLQDDWDAYVQDRKLLQPPAGITPPITTTSFSAPGASRLPVSPAVTEALQQRKRRESALGLGHGDPGTDSSDDMPLAKVHKHQRSSSTGGNIPVTILPPKKSAPIIAPVPQRPMTRTFEELTERHREKMRDLQSPLTVAEREHAELEAAKQRWERAKALEKQAVTKRQAEKAAQLEKRKKSEDDPERSGRRSSRVDNNKSRNRTSRSLSADKLGSTSKRISTMKVEDWRRYQEEQEGRSPRSGDVPFPNKEGTNHRRGRSRDVLS